MGQKVHPFGFRVGITMESESKWFAKSSKDYASYLHEDMRIREHIQKELSNAGISRIQIERYPNRIRVNIFPGKPGIIIGKKGSEVEKLRERLRKMTGKQVFVNIQEIRYLELDAQLVAENIAQQLEHRIAYRRAMKRAITSAMRLGALGIKVGCAGRLAGAEMSRREYYHEGKVPLHTLIANISYGFSLARTTTGIIGVKVWINKGKDGARKKSAGVRFKR